MEPFCDSRSLWFLPITCILRLWHNDQRKTGQSSRRLLGAGDGLGEVYVFGDKLEHGAGCKHRDQWQRTFRLHRKAFVAHFRSTVPRLHSTILNATNYIEIWCNDLSPWQELGHYLQTFQRLDAQSKGTASLLAPREKHRKAVRKPEQAKSRGWRNPVILKSFWNQFLNAAAMQLPSGIVGQEEGWGSLEESSHGGCCRKHNSMLGRPSLRIYQIYCSFVEECKKQILPVQSRPNSTIFLAMFDICRKHDSHSTHWIH